MLMTANSTGSSTQSACNVDMSKTFYSDKLKTSKLAITMHAFNCVVLNDMLLTLHDVSKLQSPVCIR
jgi:hypothetical protein